MSDKSEGLNRRIWASCLQSHVMIVGAGLIIASMILVVVGPVPVAASDFQLSRIGTYSIGYPVRAMDISEDGRWLLAGGKNAGETEGAVFLFDFDNLGSPISYSWRNRYVVPYDDWTWGSSHPVAISTDGEFFALGLKASSEQQAECVFSGNVYGCVQYYYNDAGAVTLQWQKNLTSPVPSVDVASVVAYSSNPAVVAGSGTSLKVYTLAGDLYWETSLYQTIHNVRMSRNGTYIAASTLVDAGHDAQLFFFKKGTSNYTQLWSYQGNAETLNIDFSEDGLLLAAGEDHAGWTYAIPANLTHFWPGTNGWDSGDGTPCMTYVKSDDIYSVAVAQNITVQNTTQISVRSLAGRSQGSDRYAEQHIVCDDSPSDQWSMGSFSMSVDMSVADCPLGAYCYSVAGGNDYNVSLFREGDSRVRTDRTGGSIQAIVISHEYDPRIAAGCDNGYVYFYDIAMTP